jgi:hypothetical protein
MKNGIKGSAPQTWCVALQDVVIAHDKSTSTSLGPSIIPASRVSTKILARNYLVGKVENNHGEEEEDEAFRELFEFLTRSSGRIHMLVPVSCTRL